MRKRPLLASVAFSTALLGTGAAYGADVPVVNNWNLSALTAEGLNSVKAYENPLPAPNTSGVRAETAASPAPGTPGASNAPAGSSTRAYGSFGLPYTSTRVVLGSTNKTSSVGASFLSSTSPYRQVGKLTFSAGYCSASLIRRSVIVTAAHCIQNFGSGSNIFTNWQFTPGTYAPTGATAAQIQPYGTWNWRVVVRPATWANGTDIGSGAARDNDVALIALSKNASGQFIGDVIGYLGYGWNNYSFVSSSKTGNLRVAATSTLGYPALMDSGRIMQRADGPSYLTTISGAGQIWQGSNFTGGSSGGPWIVNCGASNPVLSGGAVIGTASTRAVVGVTSWGSADPNAIKDNYSSQFRQNTRYPNADYGGYGAGNIGSLMNSLCATVVGGSTLKAQGYCN